LRGERTEIHAEMFAERIKELGGEPVVGHDGIVKKGQAIEEIFAFGSDKRFIENLATAISPRHS
jgi:bacterioferritin (cytochrome b1)